MHKARKVKLLTIISTEEQSNSCLTREAIHSFYGLFDFLRYTVMLSTLKLILYQLHGIITCFDKFFFIFQNQWSSHIRQRNPSGGRGLRYRGPSFARLGPDGQPRRQTPRRSAADGPSGEQRRDRRAEKRSRHFVAQQEEGGLRGRARLQDLHQGDHGKDRGRQGRESPGNVFGHDRFLFIYFELEKFTWNLNKRFINKVWKVLCEK